MNFGQHGWRHCNKCEGMFFALHGTFGVCPKVGSDSQHDPQDSGPYMIQQGESHVPGQANWRWCLKCEGLFFAGGTNQGVCPRDGTEHDGSESGDYILHEAGTLSGAQGDWRWCRACSGLFFGAGTRRGVCEAAGRHDPPGDSGNYAVRRAGEYRFDRTVFFTQYERDFPRLNAAQRGALDALLGFAESDPEIVDLRWIAYMLATGRAEVGANYLPIRESGCVDGRTPVCTPLPNGNTRTYGNPRRCPNLSLRPPVPCPNGQNSHTYYGRGYIQLTHQGNYRTLSARLDRGDELVHDPDAVLDARTAYDVMSVGMREGLFTGRKLSEFINEDSLDYFNARRIVNPRDTETFGPIARNAERFQVALEGSLR